MYSIIPKFDKLLEHFKNNRMLATLVFELFVFGIAVFIVNNTAMFMVEDRTAYPVPRIIMRLLTSLSWIIATVIGCTFNKTKRNMILLPGLFMYMLADVVVLFSIPYSAPFYGLGHIFLIISIMETTYIRRYQVVIFAMISLVSVPFLLTHTDGFTITGILALIYSILCIWTMAASISNHYFRVAGITFFISDLTGLARLAIMDNRYTYVITTFLYYLAIILLCVSVYNSSKKEVVTWRDLQKVLLLADVQSLRIWLAGRWAVNMILDRRKFYSEYMELAYDLSEKDKLMKWLSLCRYDVEEEYPEGLMRCYSEKFGTLYTLPCDFSVSDDGSAQMTTSHRTKLDLDEGFFTDARMFGRSIPCLVPGGDQVRSAVI